MPGEWGKMNDVLSMKIINYISHLGQYLLGSKVPVILAVSYGKLWQHNIN